MIRTAAILQLLLGNIGRPGGGILALRGHASIQGSTDIPTLYDLLPGYLNMPHAGEEDLDLERYIATGAADRGWWSFFDSYIVSLLKAWFGEAATEDNDYGFSAHSADQRATTPISSTTHANARRGRGGLLRDGPEPGRRLSARAVCSAARWPG